MTGLLEIREYLKDIYGKYDIYILPVLKLILAIITFAVIGANAGYMSRLSNPALILVLALLCSFLPVNVLVVLAALYSVANIYALSMECAVVVAAVFLIMFLVYFRFAPSDALVLVLTPICFLMHIPYAVPLCCGLAGTPASAISCACGVVVYYIFDFIKVNETDIVALDSETTVTRLRFVVDGLLSNKGMLVMAAAFAITVIVVYVIRRLAVDHAWTIAIMAGFFASMIAVLAGDMSVGVTVSIGGVILGGLVSLALAFVLKFFVFSVDYTRTERLQFEDDEYYYYVKAVPKVTLSVPEKTVKKISQHSGEDRTVRENREPKEAKDYPVFNQARLDDSGYPGAARRRQAPARSSQAQSLVSGQRPAGVRRESTLPRDRRIVQQKPADGSINYGRSNSGATPARSAVSPQGQRPVAPQGQRPASMGQRPTAPQGHRTTAPQGPRQGQPRSGGNGINYGRPPVRNTDDTRVIRKRPEE